MERKTKTRKSTKKKNTKKRSTRSTKSTSSVGDEVKKIAKRLSRIGKIELSSIAQDVMRVTQGQGPASREMKEVSKAVKDLVKVGKSLNKKNIEKIGTQGVRMILKLQPQVNKEWSGFKKDIDKEMKKAVKEFQTLRKKITKKTKRKASTRKKK